MLKVITTEKENKEIHLEDISLSKHFIAFRKKTDYGYLVLSSNMYLARLAAISFGSANQGFKIYEENNPFKSIQLLIANGYEIFAFTSRKEFYKFLAEHAEDQIIFQM